MISDPSVGTPVRRWLHALESDVSAGPLAAIYGSDAEVLRQRTQLLRRVLERFLERFGDLPLRVFRAPGRINLRGMHVDTHGGYLNLMTHQREVLVASAPAADGRCTFANIDPRFPEAHFDAEALAAQAAFALPWSEYITHPSVTAPLRKGDWANYARGAVLRARRAVVARPFQPIVGVVGSDLPRGAALSSSHVLCTAVLLAALGWNGASFRKDELILAVRDAEWFTGARTGTSDQGAMILGRRGALVNVALLAEDFDISGARYLDLPDSLRVLVINSYTERSLSGAQLAAYTRNRFAYSMALEILRQELLAMGFDPARVKSLDRLSRITPEALGGTRVFYDVLERIPESLSPEAMRARYELADFDAAYARYFGGVPAEHHPRTIGLRGPLLFGLAESERARLFLPALERGDFVRAGLLMTTGHEGDRVFRADGSPYCQRMDSEALRLLAGRESPVEECPGDYGASSAVLDALVDCALAAGALGASLTGAGIAGTVLALCRTEDAGAVSEAVRNFMGMEQYVRASKRPGPLSRSELGEAVMTNHAPEGAGELRL